MDRKNREIVLGCAPALRHFNAEGKYWLIYGKIQSGKTNHGLGIATLGIIDCRSTILIVPNLTSYYHQWQNRAREFSQKCGVNIRTYFMGEASHRKDIEKTIGCRQRAALVIVLGNHIELTMINSIISKQDHVVYQLLVDEADESYKKDVTRYAPQYQLLVERAAFVFGISGTTFKIWFTEHELFTNNIIAIEPDENYKGVKTFDFIELPKEVKPPGKSEDPHDHDEYFEPFFYEQLSLSFANHPVIWLYKSSNVNSRQFLMQEYFMEHCDLNRWCSIAVNQLGVSIYHPSLENVRLKIGGVKSKKDMRGIHKFSSLSIPTTLQWLKTNGGVDRFPHIIIFCGMMANRGMSFVSQDYQWHLTGQYLVTNLSSGPDCTNLLQYCRLCGVYPYDDIPLTFVTHKVVWDSIIKADALQDDLIRKAVLISDRGTMMRQFVQDYPLDKALVPRRRLTSKVKYALHVIDTFATSVDGLYLCDPRGLPQQARKDVNMVIKMFQKEDGGLATGIWITLAEGIKKAIKIFSIDRSQKDMESSFHHVKQRKHGTPITKEEQETSGLLVKVKMSKDDRWMIRFNCV